MKVRHVLSIADIGPEQIPKLIDDSLAFASTREGWDRPLAGKVVGIYFRGTSTRTRTSFTVAAMKLGADTITYGPNDLQTVTGESIADTTRVLSSYLDVLVIRTNGSIEEMKTLASQDRMAVINAMSSNEHPTQAVADLLTIRETLGRLEDVHILYLGEGNNSAAALALAVGMLPGMNLTLVTPEGYGLPETVLESARDFAKESHSIIEQHHDIHYLPHNVDVVYTTRWQTMGVPKTEPDWQQKFWPYRVTAELMARVSRPSGTIFLHDLPAVRGAEVTDEVLDGPQSVAFRQAENKLNSALAVLSWCVSQGEPALPAVTSEQTRSRRAEAVGVASQRH
jgi:ornithine carbamoyltransferase